MVNELRREVIAHFVCIGGIVDLHCLNVVFIILVIHIGHSVIYGLLII